MFEEMTYSNILKDALSQVSDDFDKRQGSIIYDTLAPLSAELAQAYIQLETVLNEGFASTSSREYLIKRASERGIYPYEATQSIILASLTGDISLDGGERFSTDEGIIYYYTGEMFESYYKLKSETYGEETNISFGDLLPIDNIPNLITSSIFNIFLSATDEEDTEVFRKRYFDSISNQAFGGNRADYIEKITNLNQDDEILENGGIGGVKVYRNSKGGGLVDVYITNNSFLVPTTNLISLVQEAIDPIDNSGEGVGTAPIGHLVTIYPANSTILDISLQVDLKESYTLDDLKSIIDAKIESYILESCQTWQDDTIIIRVSYIESIVLGITGVLDIKNTTINGSSLNITLDENSIPLRGVINVT
ncbi:MAG: baseplate J/gp47 family protein [bacterium]